MSTEGFTLVFTIIAEIDFNATGVFGVPLGTILLIYILMNMNNQSSRQSTGKSKSEIAAIDQRKKEDWKKFVAGTSPLEPWLWGIMVLFIPIALIIKILVAMANSTAPIVDVIVMSALFFVGGLMWVGRVKYVVKQYDQKNARRKRKRTMKSVMEPLSVPQNTSCNMDSLTTKDRRGNISKNEELLAQAKSFIRLKEYDLALEVILIYLSLPMLSKSGRQQGLRIREYARAKCSWDEQDKIN